MGRSLLFRLMAAMSIVPLSLGASGADLVVFDGSVKRWGEEKLVFEGPWDLSSHGTLRIDVENTSPDAEVCLMVDFGAQDDTRVRQKMIPAGFKGMIDIDVCPPPAKPEVAAKMKSMRTDPFMCGDRDKPYDAKRIGKIVLGHHWGGKSTASGGVVPEVIVKSVVALDTSEKAWPAWYGMDAKAFFPFIDRYGQFVHGTWPNKVTDDAALKAAAKEESADLAAHPGPEGWDRFGGWAKGPQLEATGRFRVVKRDGKWWFVDPDGRLWWSHGSVRVTPSSAVTPLDGREDYFAELPADDGKDPFDAFYHTYDELLKPYYDKKGWKRTYDFSAANLCRKYGAGWRATYADLSHRRLRSWGLNTIANSSDAGIRKMDRTPWIERLETRGPRCKEQKNEGHWWHVPDPYSPEFRSYLRGQLESRRAELCSPWCAGIFVDNEHNWGGISDKTVREYFKVIREEIKRLDPKLLYFGCRFAGAGPWHDRIASICAEYADVVSFNVYDFRIDGFALPKGVDKPVLIGEFHFGSTSDTGLFNPSLIPVADQKARAAAYGRYVRDALEHPLIVGTHWHQFSDQPTTGRFDGENFNVGFTDVCDRPYDEMRTALREIGAGLYDIRARSPRRTVPASRTYDVVVVGAGSAGVPAGVAAASEGAKTLVLERNTLCGGTIVTAAVNFPSLFHLWGEQRIAGVGWNVATNALFMDGGRLPDFKRPCGTRQWEHGFRVNVPLFSALCEEALTQAGAEILYRASPTALRKTLSGWEVDVAASGEIFTVACRELVDCTGNGTVAAMAGARRVRETENPQPATFMWRFEPNVDRPHFDAAKLQESFDAAVRAGELKATDSSSAFGPVKLSDFVNWRGGNANYVTDADNSTAWAATRTDKEGRAMMLRMYRFLRRQPGLENLHLTSVPSEVGVRETYRVVGEKTVTGEAYLSGRVEDDSICYACYPVDIHDLKGGLKRGFPKEGVVPTVPFGALVPKGVRDLLVAGRCLSSDREANSALRVQATCMATGEAVGVAAALAARRGVTPGALPVSDVRAILKKRGCIVPEK